MHDVWAILWVVRVIRCSCQCLTPCTGTAAAKGSCQPAILCTCNFSRCSIVRGSKRHTARGPRPSLFSAFRVGGACLTHAIKCCLGCVQLITFYRVSCLSSACHSASKQVMARVSRSSEMTYASCHNTRDAAHYGVSIALGIPIWMQRRAFEVINNNNISSITVSGDHAAPSAVRRDCTAAVHSLRLQVQCLLLTNRFCRPAQTREVPTVQKSLAPNCYTAAGVFSAVGTAVAAAVPGSLNPKASTTGTQRSHSSGCFEDT